MKGGGGGGGGGGGRGGGIGRGGVFLGVRFGSYRGVRCKFAAGSLRVRCQIEVSRDGCIVRSALSKLSFAEHVFAECKL